jgi:hypothetical protein
MPCNSVHNVGKNKIKLPKADEAKALPAGKPNTKKLHSRRKAQPKHTGCYRWISTAHPTKHPTPAIDPSSVTLKDKVVFNEQLELGNKENKKKEFINRRKSATGISPIATTSGGKFDKKITR